MKVQLERIKDEIIGLRPVYTDTGNATMIYLRRGEDVDSRGIRSVMNALTRAYAIDLGAQRSLVEERLHRQGMMPFYLGAERVFVPLKMRRARACKDAVYGYVDVGCMGEVYEVDQRTCRLQLLDGRELEILSHRSTVEQSRVMGRSLLEMLQGERRVDPGEELVVGAVVQFHHKLKVIERRLIHIEEMIAEGEDKYR